MKLVKIQAIEMEKTAHLNGGSKHIQHYNKALEREKQIITKYIEVSCRQLCAKLTNTLPREVRDMVYSKMLYNGGYPEIKVPQYDTNYEPSSIYPTSYADCPPQFVRKFFGRNGKYCFDDACVGTTFATEFTQAFYGVSTFVFPPYTVRNLPLLLRANEPMLSDSIRPLALVNHLELHFFPDVSKADLEALSCLYKLESQVEIVFILFSRRLQRLNPRYKVEEHLDSDLHLLPIVRKLQNSKHKCKWKIGFI